MEKQWKAIETVYKGCRFRSRLEARWACFFEAAGIEWQYEPEGFEVTDHLGAWVGRYLPDFFLPQLKTWVEVKGDIESLTDNYLEIIANAVDWGRSLPHVQNSYGKDGGLLWLGNVPECSDTQIPIHVILQHSKGGYVMPCHFNGPSIIVKATSLSEYFDSSGGDAHTLIKHALQNICRELPYWTTKTGCNNRLANAYQAARSARFEHGESGYSR